MMGSVAQKRGNVVPTIFTSMVRISAVTFGGGYVIAALMKKRFVEDLGLLREEEMLDMIALAGSLPGPIAVNVAVMAGWRIAGFAGMVAGVLGTIIPPVLILALVSLLYGAFAGNPLVQKVLAGLQIGVAAIMADAVCTMAAGAVKQHAVSSSILLVLCFVAAWFFKVSAIYIILGAVLFSAARALRAMVSRAKEARK